MGVFGSLSFVLVQPWVVAEPRRRKALGFEPVSVKTKRAASNG